MAGFPPLNLLYEPRCDKVATAWRAGTAAAAVATGTRQVLAVEMRAAIKANVRTYAFLLYVRLVDIFGRTDDSDTDKLRALAASLPFQRMLIRYINQTINAIISRHYREDWARADHPLHGWSRDILGQYTRDEQRPLPAMVVAWIAAQYACVTCAPATDVADMEVPARWVYYRDWDPRMRVYGIPQPHAAYRLDTRTLPEEGDDADLPDAYADPEAPFANTALDFPSGSVRFSVWAAEYHNYDRFMGVFSGDTSDAIDVLLTRRIEPQVLPEAEGRQGVVRLAQEYVQGLGGLLEERAPRLVNAFRGFGGGFFQRIGQAYEGARNVLGLNAPVIDAAARELERQVLRGRILQRITAEGQLLRIDNQRPGIFYGWSGRSRFSLEMLQHLQTEVVGEAYTQLLRGIDMHAGRQDLRLSQISTPEQMERIIDQWLPQLATLRHWEYIRRDVPGVADALADDAGPRPILGPARAGMAAASRANAPEEDDLGDFLPPSEQTSIGTLTESMLRQWNRDLENVRLTPPGDTVYTFPTALSRPSSDFGMQANTQLQIGTLTLGSQDEHDSLEPIELTTQEILDRHTRAAAEVLSATGALSTAPLPQEAHVAWDAIPMPYPSTVDDGEWDEDCDRPENSSNSLFDVADWTMTRTQTWLAHSSLL